MANTFPTMQAGVSISSTKTTNYRTLSMSFGNGYSQTAPDGINNQVDTWALSFTNMGLTDYNNLMAFFNTVGSSLPITWQSPVDSVAKLFKVDIQTGVQTTVVAGNIFSVSTKLVQVF